MKNRFTILSWTLILGLLLLLHVCSGCSPSRRLFLLQKNHPYLFENDSITEIIKIKDSTEINIPGVNKIFPIPFNELSGFRYSDSSINVNIQYDTILDTLYLELNSNPQKIYVPFEVEIPCTTQFFRRPRDSLVMEWINSFKWNHFLFIFMLLTLVIFIYKNK